ncbi:MAG TPA: sugar ABC transporter permease [Longimicrobiaceae bacterium]|nr:sugar ABC transporter permease [Longimicrobiaceae bacterium]
MAGIADTGTSEVATAAPAGAALAASGRGRLRPPGEDNRAAWVFLAPALALIGVFFFLPVVAALALSFTDCDISAIGDASNARFVGFRNYAQLMRTPLFWQALRNTFYFALVGGPLTIGAALAAALLLNAKAVRLKGFFRTVYFAPFVTTLVAVAIVWRYLYHTRYGLLNYALSWVGIAPVDWLGDPRWALPAIILMAVWKNFGYNMLIFIAGLQAIPEELYEAARIDGATALQRFRHVTIPQLGPTLLFVGVITMIGYFQLFVEPYVMTQGGPLRSTTSVVLLMYEEGFRWWRMGFAAAVAFVLFVIILAATLVQLRLQRAEER